MSITVTGDDLKHIGIKRRSGRYPWGSGKNPYQRAVGFKTFLDDMRSQGLSDTEIANSIQSLLQTKDPHAKFSTADLRAGISISTNEIRTANQNTAAKLKATGMSNRAIAEEMGLGSGKSAESTVRGWLKPSQEIKDKSLAATANALKEQLASGKEYLDVGKGNNLWLGVSTTKLNVALSLLKDEGYNVHEIKAPQLGTDKLTNYKVLTSGENDWRTTRDAVINGGKLRVITAQSDDGGLTYRIPKDEPVSVSSKRIDIRYAEDGGTTMDGVIEVRRGVPDLDLGSNRYAQVRVPVDGSHYLKGMAMYADDLPAGVDIRFNTNKTKDTPGGKLGVMKKMNVTPDGKIDGDNPFGATTHPKVYVDKNGKEHTSSLNFVNEEGRWDQWSRSLSSQMLSKQPITLASRQLEKARISKEDDFNTIMGLTNPVVKKKLLEEFADSADAAAVHLKAASLPRQSTHVILPMNSLRPNEIYAPNFNNGEKVVLVRHPHGGPFEIPDLTVNNNNRTAKRILQGAKDAVGIHHSVAEVLSGADFDGDTVLVIPNDRGLVKRREPLAGLKGFDPKAQYKIPDDDTTTPRMTKKNTQTEMGRISNLITDMTIKGASDTEIAAAVRHSMVVIDAEKHGLNYKQSAIDNRISELKQKYQGGANKGAATIISRASSEANIPQVKARGIDPKTGRIIYEPTGKVRKAIDKNGNVVEIAATTKGTKMEFTTDARTLLSKNPEPMEEVYASHANSMKDLANRARKASVELEMPSISPSAKVAYKNEIASLDAKLKIALQNAPLERRAQIIGGALAKARIDRDPTLDKDAIKKIKYQSLQEGREATGANKSRVYVTDREWLAIQSHAIGHTKLSEIMANGDMDRIKELAAPRRRSSLSPGQMARAQAMLATGKSLTQVAEQLGIPRTTLTDNINRK